MWYLPGNVMPLSKWNMLLLNLLIYSPLFYCLSPCIFDVCCKFLYPDTFFFLHPCCWHQCTHSLSTAYFSLISICCCGICFVFQSVLWSCFLCSFSLLMLSSGGVVYGLYVYRLFVICFGDLSSVLMFSIFFSCKYLLWGYGVVYCVWSMNTYSAWEFVWNNL